MENLQNQNQQNSFNQPVQQNPKKQVSTLVGIIIIIVAAGILFGGVFAYTYYNKIHCIGCAPVPESEFNIQNQKNNQVDSWKTYKNDEYGFEFKYPIDYKAQGLLPLTKSPGLLVSFPSSLLQEVYVQEISNFLTDFNLPGECTFTSNDLEDKILLSFINTKKINGVIFYHYTNYPKYISSSCDASWGCVYKDVYRTSRDGKCYQIGLSRQYADSHQDISKEEGETFVKIFDQILSTFKFTK